MREAGAENLPLVFPTRDVFMKSCFAVKVVALVEAAEFVLLFILETACPSSAPIFCHALFTGGITLLFVVSLMPLLW